ncbi:MAG: glutathione S-transferase family protein [Pseudomonadota bacterium]
MKIYGHHMSMPANQVRLTASAIGTDAEYVHVELARQEQRGEAFQAVNPFGKVPAIEDGDFRLSESNAISRYLACRDGQCGLYPDDIRLRAEIDQWMDYAAQHVRANIAKVLFNKVLAPMMGAPVDEGAMAEGGKLLASHLRPVEARLSEHAFLVGDRLTLAEPAMVAALDPLEMIAFDASGFPNVTAWRERQMGSDWYKRVHERYGAEGR